MTVSGTALRAIESTQPITGNMFTSPAMFEHLQRVARVLCASSLIPDHLKRNNGADAVMALQIALDRGESPVSVLQAIYFVAGKAGWSATYMIARANKSGTFKGPIRWRSKGEGDQLEVTAIATLADTGEEVDATVSMVMAKAEGWTANKKYQSMPLHMLRWRSATMLIRLYAPETLIGMSTVDELEDMRAAGQLKDVTEEGHVSTADAVAATLRGEDAGRPPIEEPPPSHEPPAEREHEHPADDQPPAPEPEPAVAAGPRNWDVHPTQPGEEPKRRAILELLALAETVEDVDDIERHHQAFLEKLNRTKAVTRDQFRIRRAQLAPDGAA